MAMVSYRLQQTTVEEKLTHALRGHFVIRTEIVTIQKINSRIWEMLDACNINNLAKNQVSAVFHSRSIRRSALPKFRELCMELPCLCPSEGHKHSGRDVTKTSVFEFCH